MSRIWIAQTTVDSEEAARELAEGAVREKLVACAHIDGPFQSVYFWNDTVEVDQEWRVTFKTSSCALQSLKTWLHREHSYETPQWVWWEAQASDGYAGWASDVTRTRQSKTAE